jgi:hypothetical protein
VQSHHLSSTTTGDFRGTAAPPLISLYWYPTRSERCAGQVKIIACIEDPAVIERILAHLNGKAPSAEPAMLPEERAPPLARLFD